jgi:hypothetical protein
MPLQRRLPKRGFTNIFRVDFQETNVAALGILDSAEITPELLREKGVVRGRKKPIKILGGGEITRAMTVKAHAFSKSAIEKIEKAGGTIEIIGTPKGKRKRAVTATSGKSDSIEEEGQSEAQTETGQQENPGGKDTDSGDQG